MDEQAHAGQPLSVLIIEDFMPDAELEIRQLRKDGFEVSADVVDSREAFVERVRSKTYDLVLADYQLPQWTGTEVLELLKKEKLEIPVILVTGAVGEEVAADCIKRGIVDYVLKQRLGHLPRAVRTALEEKTWRGQAKLAEATRSLLAAIVESSEDAITGETLEGVITSWNGAAHRLYGYAAEEAMGQPNSIIVPPDRSQAEEEALEALRQGAHVAHLETVRVRKDGTRVDVSVTFSTIRDREGSIVGYSTIAHDITERKQVEQQLRLQAAALASAANGILITNRQGQIIWMNPALSALSGYSAEEILGQNPRLFKSGQQDAAFYKNLWDTISAGHVWHGEIVNCRKDGTLYPEEMTITPVHAVNHEITHFVAVKQDITERKQAQEELSASEARYRRLFERSQDGILVAEVVNSEMGRITDANPAALRMLESTPDQVFGKRLWEIEAFRRGGATPETFRRLRKRDLPLLPRSGKRMDVEFMAIAYHVGDKDVVQCSLRDVTLRRQAEQEAKALNDVLEERVTHRTEELAALNEELTVEIDERKAVEEALERLQRQTELTLNSAGEAIFRIDLDGTCTFANPAATHLLGYSREELLGQNVHAIGDHYLADGSPCRPENCQVQTALKQGAVQMAENQMFTRRDGAKIWVDSVTAPMTEGDKIIGAVQILRDVSERRAIEKMKDEFVSVVSHELRTPLTAIRGALGLLAKGKFKAQPGRAQHLLELAISNSDRLTRLINDILDSARLEHGGPPLVRKRCAAGELVTQAVDLMRPMAEAAAVEITVDSDAFNLSVDPDAILQVLTNLLSNAIKFSPAGSQVRVEAARDGVCAVFRVIDHGQGIPADKLKSIFGRFQTVDASDTRRRGGSGLGLFICRGIVQRHGGKIWAESKLGSGSTFVFTLPLEG
jgi:PAS domain S-box-containing protein